MRGSRLPPDPGGIMNSIPATLELPKRLERSDGERFAEIKPLQMSPALSHAVKDELDILENTPGATGINRIENRMVELSNHAPGEELDIRNLTLQAKRRFARGMIEAAEKNFNDACLDLRFAAYGFALLDRSPERDLAIVECIYNEGYRAVRNNNIGKAFEQFNKARKYVDSNRGVIMASRVGITVEDLLDAMDFDSTVLQAGVTYQRGAPDEAGLLYSRASVLAQAIAERQQSGRLQEFWLGNAKLISAAGAFVTSMNALALYAFDRVPVGKAQIANEAEVHLKKADGENASLAGFLSQFLGIAEGMAAIMKKVLSARYTPQPKRFKDLHQRVSEARARASELDKSVGLDLSRSCGMMDTWLDNLEHQSRPSKRDFGIYSGLVACVVFAVVLALILAANKLFSLGASGALVLQTSVGLGLVAGFGLGAVKFRSLFWGGTQDNGAANHRG
jgi:hypothetical protein